MRANMTIVGFGQRRQGVSTKTQKPYDFQSVSVLYEDAYTTGHKAATVNISGPDIDAKGGIKVGETLDVVFHTYNNAVVVDAVL